MKARGLPQDETLLDLVENLKEIIWSKITSGVKRFVQSLIENLLEDEFTDWVGAHRYGGKRSVKRIVMVIINEAS